MNKVEKAAKKMHEAALALLKRYPEPTSDATWSDATREYMNQCARIAAEARLPPMDGYRMAVATQQQVAKQRKDGRCIVTTEQAFTMREEKAAVDKELAAIRKLAIHELFSEDGEIVRDGDDLLLLHQTGAQTRARASEHQDSTAFAVLRLMQRQQERKDAANA